jgi:hypothetical protein
MSDTTDPPVEQSVVAAIPVPDPEPADLATAIASECSNEARLAMTSHLNSFLHRGRVTPVERSAPTP